MKKIFIENLISIKQLSLLLEINEIEFIKLTFLKGIIIKKNEILNFETAKKICKIFNCEVFEKQNLNNINIKELNYFYISIIGNVNTGKTTLIDFIFKKNICLKEIGKISQTVNIFETLFFEKKIFFFDLPGHKLFSKIIKTYINFSNLIFLIISVENEIDEVYETVTNLVKNNNQNLIICLNKIDKKNNKNIFFEKIKYYKISSANGYGVKNLIKESIRYFISLNKINSIKEEVDGIIINSLFENNEFITTLFLLKGELRINNFLYFNDDKILINNLFLNEKKITFCKSPFIFKTKNIYFPIEIFFSLKNNINNIKIKNIYKENYHKFFNYFIKTNNHTISLSIKDFYNNLKNNNKINLEVRLGNFTEKDFKYCLNFNYKIFLIDSKVNNNLKKKIIEKKIFFKEFLLLNDVIDYFLNKYSLNKTEIILGELIILDIFPCGKNKKIAGCKVMNGIVHINNFIKVYKELKLIFQGKINTLKKNSNSVSYVEKNEECGINIKNFNNIEIGLKIISIEYV